MKPTLLILAAGLGSRYGGVKQMDQVGPSGESIIDYSIYDAIQAGFGKVVFVLNEKIIDDFKAIYQPRLAGKIETEYVLQRLTDIPEGVNVHPDRVKPWGTGHAVLVTKEVIQEPFAVINADDFYGQSGFKLIADFLSNVSNDSADYAMVGYVLENTLSDHGTVNRGVSVAENGLLVDVVERLSIHRQGDKAVFEEDGEKKSIDLDSVVSMNFWGFTPKYFEQSGSDFETFLQEKGGALKSEFFIPLTVNKLIKEGEATCKVLTSHDNWFGVTYKEDKPITVAKVRELVDQGVYPENLWVETVA